MFSGNMPVLMLCALALIVWQFWPQVLAVVQQFSPQAKKPAAAAAGTGGDRQAFKTELLHFQARFGKERGLRWFLEDRPYAEALELYVAELEKADAEPSPPPA